MRNHRVRTAVIGCGSMARHHLRVMQTLRESTHVVVVSEPSEAAYASVVNSFKAAGLKPPPNQPDLNRLLSEYGPNGRGRSRLDAAFIITPHACHFEQARACLEAGLDVLLEKPMVMNTTEALQLIEARDRTGKLLVVAFNGSLSPQIRTAAHMLRSGELGRMLSISGVVWQNWGTATTGTWRQQRALSGGGFLFDTGAHLLNTVADLAGEDFVEVAAWLEHNGRPVETLAAVMGRLQSGALVTLHACGETIPVCASDLRVFCTEGILYTGVWGEKLEVQRTSRPPEPVAVPASLGVWEQFLQVRAGGIPNPSPPEIGLRMSRLWDAINVSAGHGGAPVRTI